MRDSGWDPRALRALAYWVRIINRDTVCRDGIRHSHPAGTPLHCGPDVSRSFRAERRDRRISTCIERDRVGSESDNQPNPSREPSKTSPGVQPTPLPVQPSPEAAETPSGTVTQTVPIAPPLSGQGRHVYVVGTLVYTGSMLVILFLWLLWGDFALSMRDRSVGPLVEKFLLKYGASNTLKQVLTSFLPTAIALLLSPVVSYRSDRLRSKWGRRIPFLMIPTPIAGLAMVGIAFSPQIGSWLFAAMGNVVPVDSTLEKSAGGHIIGVFTVFWTIFEVAVIISGSVFFGLINDVVPRPVLGRFHGLFRAVSLYDGIFFNAILFQYAEQHFTLMFALIGLLFGGGFTLMCLKVKEGNYPPPPVDEALLEASGTGFIPWLVSFLRRFFHAAGTYLRECYSHPYFLMMFAMFVLAGLTFNPINSFSYRYAMQLKMSDGDYGFLIAVSYLVSLTIAFPLGMTVDKVHAFRAAIFTMGLYTITMLLGSLFVHDAPSFGWAFIGHTILSGTYFTCAASLPQQLYPRSKYSQYASAGGILGSLAGLAFAPSIGGVMDLTNNNYHLTFWFGLVLSILTIALMLLLYRRFNAYGGRQAYLAPGDTGDARSRPDPPAHMPQILSLYFVGALVGIAGGYLLAYGVNYLLFEEARVPLARFHTLLNQIDQVRNMTTFCAATGVIPGALLGAVAGNAWAKRLERKELGRSAPDPVGR